MLFGMIRSFEEHKGWFSYGRNTYRKVEDTAIFGTYSFNYDGFIDPFNKKLNGIPQGLVVSLLEKYIFTLSFYQYTKTFPQVDTLQHGGYERK
jgi:hypothetical protein